MISHYAGVLFSRCFKYQPFGSCSVPIFDSPHWFIALCEIVLGFWELPAKPIRSLRGLDFLRDILDISLAASTFLCNNIMETITTSTVFLKARSIALCSFYVSFFKDSSRALNKCLSQAVLYSSTCCGLYRYVL